MQIQSIPGKFSSTWHSDVKSVVDTWLNYTVSLEEFKEAVLNKSLNFAKSKGVKAWIVDSSAAKGAFSQEIQNFIGTDVFPVFAQNGIKTFITISSKVSSVTNMAVKSYSKKLGPSGITLVEAQSVDGAKEWLKTNS